MTDKINPALLKEYERIMENEFHLKYSENTPLVRGSIFTTSATEVYRQVEQLAEVAKSSLLPRSYIKRYGLSESRIAYESVGAHTNLMAALIDRALCYYYGPDFGEPGSEWAHTEDNFSYRDIMEAVRIHDLPENKIGDWPDNGSSDPNKKAKLERLYLREFSQGYDLRNSHVGHQAIRLFELMDVESSVTGRLLKLADKTAALFITLCYDSAGAAPLIHISDPKLSERDRQEMQMCDYNKAGYHKASEMWAIDHFCIRKFCDLDDDSFFTAIIVMYTLMVNGKWYSWREKDYLTA